jgi:hypothetical protein
MGQPVSSINCAERPSLDASTYPVVPSCCNIDTGGSFSQKTSTMNGMNRITLLLSVLFVDNVSAQHLRMCFNIDTVWYFTDSVTKDSWVPEADVFHHMGHFPNGMEVCFDQEFGCLESTSTRLTPKCDGEIIDMEWFFLENIFSTFVYYFHCDEGFDLFFLVKYTNWNYSSPQRVQFCHYVILDDIYTGYFANAFMTVDSINYEAVRTP